MLIEIALIIIIVIVITTELIKYTYVKYFSNTYLICERMKNQFNINDATGINENTLFKRDINNGYTLRYW